jgi:hypothetical protein
MAGWMRRVVGAARLDRAVFEEIEADKDASVGALGVVVLAAVAGGIGAWGNAALVPSIILAVASLFAWFAWALTVWFLGTKILPSTATQADLGQLLRTTGFASGPGLLRALGGVQGIGPLLMAIAPLWMLVSMIAAVRHALDYRGTARAVLVCLLGFVLYAIVLGGIAMMLGVAGSLVGMNGSNELIG